MTEREITIRAIEAYLTADKITHRKPKAEQILVAIERLGYKSPEEVRQGKEMVREAFRFPK